MIFPDDTRHFKRKILINIQIYVTTFHYKRQFLLDNLTTLNHVWSIQLLMKETNQYGPQYAFKMSMFMCPAVHMSTRSLLRSSSTHKPSDPPLRVEFKIFHLYYIKRNKITTRVCKHNDLNSLFGRMSRQFCQYTHLK